jgi:cytochrome c
MLPSRLLAASAMLVLATVAAAGEMPAGDATAGARVFRKCAVCHYIDRDEKRIGPSLMGVIGRQAGSWGEFRYSPAMVEAGASGLVWLPDVLFDYLVKPRDYVKGTRMTFPGLPSEQDRADVIAYILQFSDPSAEAGTPSASGD